MDCLAPSGDAGNNINKGVGEVLLGVVRAQCSSDRKIGHFWAETIFEASLLSSGRERDRFLEQHHGDVLANRVEP